MEFDELVDIVGEPDRTLNLLNVIHVWDDCGLLVYCKPEQTQVNSIAVDFFEQNYDFSPRQQFRGEVHIKDKIITAQATQETLREAGLSKDANLPFLFIRKDSRYSIIAEHTGLLQNLSIEVSQ